MNDAIRMQISAFVDGELPDNEADLLLRRMGQDSELRQKVADYIAIGRALRGEMFVPGVDRIHERVSAEIDDKPFEAEIETTVTPPTKAIRPLAGVAIAATVALVAIFALQQTMSVNGTDPATPEGVVADVDTGYTVPQQVDDQLRQYFLSHGAIATENGASSINSRIVSLRLSEEALDESAGEEDTAADNDADEIPTQP
jgi:negative regulator of sigma E activity